jgi:hypothetical protein
MNDSTRTEKSFRIQKSSQRKVERGEFEKLVEQVLHAQDEHELNHSVDAAMKYLHGMEDSLHNPLKTYRNKEQGDYSDRAEKRGFDYTRLYNYQEGYNHHNPKKPIEASLAHEMSDLQKKIAPVEEMLKDVHSLMSLLEQCREVGLHHLADKKNSDKRIAFDNSVANLIEKHHQFMQNPNFLLVTEYEDQMEDGEEDLSTITACPDREVVGYVGKVPGKVGEHENGKTVLALFPHFSVEGWKQSYQTRDMRTGIPKEPITQIRLQGKLWDVFAGKEGPLKQATGQWDPMQWRFIVDSKSIMTFLPRSNPNSKVCEYFFAAPAKDNWGHPLMNWNHAGHQVPMEYTYSIVFKPAKNQHMEPRDKSSDPVHDQLAQEIEGENLKHTDVSSHKTRHAAIKGEMDQRLARRDFDEFKDRRLHRLADDERLHHHKNLGLPAESVYLSPGDIKAQTYGRVHVPDHRYHRVYDHTDVIRKARAATPQELHHAQEGVMENEAREALEGEPLTSKEMGKYRTGRMVGQEGHGKSEDGGSKSSKK